MHGSLLSVSGCGTVCVYMHLGCGNVHSSVLIKLKYQFAKRNHFYSNMRFDQCTSRKDTYTQSKLDSNFEFF